MHIRTLYALVFLGLFTSKWIGAQDQTMSPETYDIWNSIENPRISRDGHWVSYELVPGKGDSKLVLYNTQNQSSIQFDRASSPRFDYHSRILCFRISCAQDSLEKFEREGIKKDKWPKDTLGIYHLDKAVFDKIGPIRSYDLPGESGGYIAIHMEAEPDSSALKKENEKNGTRLLVYDTEKALAIACPYVKSYSLADRSGRLAFITCGKDSTRTDHLVLANTLEGRFDTLISENAAYPHLSFNDSGTALSVMMYADSLRESQADPKLLHWQEGMAEALALVDSSHPLLLDDWRISPYQKPEWSDDGARLYFGFNQVLPLPDSSLLKSEKVDLEIWHYEDGLLYTQQKEKSRSEKERSFTVMYDFKTGECIPLGSPDNPEVYLDTEFSSDYILSYNEKPYEKYISWIGYAFKDLFITDIRTGERKMIAKKVQGSPAMSPSENFIYWYSRPDTSWFSYNIQSNTLVRLTENAYYDELNDRPMHPYSSGMLGWLENDAALIVYDHYDMWKVDPVTGAETRLTEGRENQLRYRHISLDRDIRAYPHDTTLLLKIFDERDKSSGYALMNLATSEISVMLKGPYAYSSRVLKAETSDKLVFTKESFQLFPNLLLSSLDFKNQQQISDANPQQEDYGWGSIELFSWEDYAGEPTEGLLVKPPGFDPSRKYPLIINFYERSSHRLHDHRAPYPHRSTINYSYWSNKGYVIFNPDIRYRVGYPGQSCYDAVMSGVEALLEQGFIDDKRMGLQGHSWGGYQIADLITRTDIFACAESGAPVVNMTSAYGGIRWGTGRSRMFQYEQTQSRLGATLWDAPELYLENSPLFRMDKVSTPVLILHNDHDGHVPWYQGIEYFVALRRLGKPAWMLNYNDEPHWPLKRQNRLDFNIRLEQFFDHYLMGMPMPVWMKDGVPAYRAEIENGLGY